MRMLKKKNDPTPALPGGEGAETLINLLGNGSSPLGGGFRWG